MTGLIIAAGNQSRFKSDIPKALSIVKGEVLAVRNYNILKKHLDKVFIVVSDSNRKYFKEYFDDDKLLNIGKSGLGSGDAIHKSMFMLDEQDIVFICWGDTVLDDTVVSSVINSYKNIINLYIGIPVVYEENPYVQFKDNKVYFSKYGDPISSGYHDLSMFIGSSSQIKLATESFRCKFYDSNTETYSHKHGNEFEFLDIFNDTRIQYKLIKFSNVKDNSFNTLEELNSINKLV